LRHSRIEAWSGGDSSIHRLHATVKIFAAFAVLFCIATLDSDNRISCATYLVLLALTLAVAGLPVLQVMARAAAVLPFAIVFATVSALSGETGRAVMLVVRGYLSALTALLLVSTTRMPELLRGLELLRVPRFLLQVMQFLYRYLIVLMEEAASMRDASHSRAGSIRTLELKKAAGAAAVLFARAYARANGVHQAMMARGFDGHIPRFRMRAYQVSDALFTGFAVALAIAVRTLPA
jgi:cobalt/nickel transport system permease protein